MELRAYQVRAVDDARASVTKGKRAPLLCAPPGAGKTTIAAAIASRRIAKGGRVAWFAHRIELVDQAKAALAKTGAPGDRYSVGTYQGVVASGQAPEADLVVFDECHWLGVSAEAWRRIPEAYASAIRVGLSATPERGDGSALEGFDSIVPVSSYTELIALGHLVPCDVYSPPGPLKNREIIARPVDAYLARTPGQLAVCFGPTVEACSRFADEFRALGVPAEVVHAECADRAEILARWRARTTMVVCNVGILTEGFDLPEIACVILARSVGTCGLYLQTTGRGLRPAPGKTRCTLLDLSGAAHLHGSPTCDRVYSLEGKGISQAGVEVAGAACSICGLPPPCACGGREAKDVRVTGTVAELQPWIVAMRAEPDDARVVRLARWIQQAKLKGWKLGHARHRFKAVYGQWPSSTMWAQAEGLAR